MKLNSELFEALKRNSPEKVIESLKKGADANAKIENDFTALMCAVTFGS